ncbi:hypothetical protein LI012_15980 [Caldibacillus thermoamylovorans]|uniref:hypothetical protein n=1 Tax=Caldibacillus thermoamylovorans TaxID=35841 RepID=UPI001D082683|nr:hypothetical protein [Caldibacillus thermoamylovorans]MCB5936753.1 hypothetical protein [Bacillus sp. DFI.2.34]MCB7078287.1 hypothetical protein [Caldibacillus thermoamylovorans]
MILNDCVTFYHASPVENLKVIEPQKAVRNTYGGKVSGKYACLASSPAQAFYWANVLRQENELWYIYKVQLAHDDIVENCIGGYHFEGVGRLVPAVEVTDHKDVDGEVCIFKPVEVTGLYAVVDFKKET